MKAFVFTEAGKIEKKEVPDISFDPFGKDAGNVLMEPLFLSPCTSDVHTVFEGRGPRRENMILGHEGIGRVTAAGCKVRDFAVGDVAAVSAVMPDVPDGNGHENAAFSGSKLGRNLNGMWAEAFLVPDADRQLAHIPEGMDVKTALMCADVAATGYTAAECAQIRPGMTVVVLGTGAVGLAAMAAAKSFGAGNVIGVGAPDRTGCIRMAEAFGADYYISYRDGRVLFNRQSPEGLTNAEPGTDEGEDGRPGTGAGSKCASDRLQLHPLANSTKSRAVERILELIGGQGADRVLICGHPETALSQACDLLRYGSGVCVNVAYIGTDGTVELPVFSLGRGMAGKTFKFELARGGRSYLERMFEFARGLEAGGTGLSALITQEFSGFDSLPDALDAMRRKNAETIKVMVAVKDR